MKVMVVVKKMGETVVSLNTDQARVEVRLGGERRGKER